MAERSLVSASTLTDRYQTTIPSDVRKALNLHKREKICYTIQPNGEVLLSRADQNDSDPVLAPFLNLLANDIEQNPERLQTIRPDFIAHIKNLVGDDDIDLDAPLDDESK